MKIEIDVEAAINQMVADAKKYTDDKCRRIEAAVISRTNQALREIIENSPIRKKVPKSGIRKDKTGRELKANLQPGAYRKGWIKYISTARPGRTQGYVRNRTNYQLTHLLELGHKSRNGGMVSPIIHIVPAQNDAREDLLKDIEKIMSEE